MFLDNLKQVNLLQRKGLTMGSQEVLSKLNDTVFLSFGLSQQCASAALKSSIKVSRDAQRKHWRQQ